MLYRVLYTHQKTKKNKIWQDGYIQMPSCGQKAALLSDEKKKLDTIFIGQGKLSVGTALESDKFIIEVDEECILGENVPEEAIIEKPSSGFPRNIQMVTVKRQGLKIPSKQKKPFQSPLIPSTGRYQQFQKSGSGKHDDTNSSNGSLHTYHGSLNNGRMRSFKDENLFSAENTNYAASFNELYGRPGTRKEIKSNELHSPFFSDPFSHRSAENRLKSESVRENDEYLNTAGMYPSRTLTTNASGMGEKVSPHFGEQRQASKRAKRSTEQILALFAKHPKTVETVKEDVADCRRESFHIWPKDNVCNIRQREESASPGFTLKSSLDFGARHEHDKCLLESRSSEICAENIPDDDDDDIIASNKVELPCIVDPHDDRIMNTRSTFSNSVKSTNSSTADGVTDRNGEQRAESRLVSNAFKEHSINPLTIRTSRHPGSLFPYLGLENKEFDSENVSQSIDAGMQPDYEYSPVFDIRCNSAVETVFSDKEPLIRGAKASNIVRRQSVSSTEAALPSPGVYRLGDGKRGEKHVVSAGPRDHFGSELSPFASVPNIKCDYQDNEATLYSDDDLMPQAYNECVPVNSIKREPSKRVGLSRLSKSFQPTYSNHTRDCARFESGQPMNADLQFPSLSDCEQKPLPTRATIIPVEFKNLAEYKTIFRSALIEHLNIVLFDLAKSYHAALKRVHINVGSETTSDNAKSSRKGPSCHHGECSLRSVKKIGPNKGKLFYCCPENGPNQCKYFMWADEYQKKVSGRENREDTTQKISLNDSSSVNSFFSGQGIAFYCDCKFIKKIKDSYSEYAPRGRFKQGKSKRHIDDPECHGGKKSIFLTLPFKASSSSYSKDDLWIISKNFSFDLRQTFIAKSSFFGPSSSGELQIVPIHSYSPSNWKSGETVHAILACNAGTEISCMENLDNISGMNDIPILRHLIFQRKVADPGANRFQNGSFTCPRLSSNWEEFDYGQMDILEMSQSVVSKYRLNEDQSLALRKIANMVLGKQSFEGDDDSHVALIHGIFGAGKSFLLAVVILFLVDIFKKNWKQNQASTHPWKILISSTTNVAVDRVLQGLLDLGFEEFIRVGSVKKIAKPILPYSVHAAGSDSQELKELQGLLKSDLSMQERAFVKKSIERHRVGLNRKKLQEVPVVGVTCAASVFPSLDNLSFKVHLLDECSQMTEPLSMLPIARFKCQDLILVGDPKQLSPTIQGSEASNENGLERTLFDRLKQKGIKPVMLRTQYRCHPMISAISNTLFYDGQLLDGILQDDRSPLLEWLNPVCFFNVPRGKEKCGSDGSFYNMEEAEFVIYLINAMLLHGLDPSNIGVITQYKSQVQRISVLLNERSISSTSSELKSIQISTVDAFQGAEKEIIILSTVRTDHVGFIDCERRTNVALTRAKRHLLIVGNLNILSRNSLWSKIIDCCSINEEGVTSAKAFSSKMDPIIKEKQHIRELDEKKSKKRKGGKIESKTSFSQQNETTDTHSQSLSS